MNQVDEKPLPGFATWTSKTSETLLTNDKNYVCDAGYIHTNA